MADDKLPGARYAEPLDDKDEFGNERPPTFDELITRDEARRLLKIKLGYVQAIGDTWIRADDHLICTAVELRWVDGSRYVVSIWGLSPKAYADMAYAADSHRAMAAARPYVLSQMVAEKGLEGILDELDDPDNLEGT